MRETNRDLGAQIGVVLSARVFQMETMSDLDLQSRCQPKRAPAVAGYPKWPPEKNTKQNMAKICPIFA